MTDLNQHPADSAARGIVGQRWDDDGPQDLPAHRHRRGQLIYTACGVVTVRAESSVFVVPPHRALWMPPGADHAASYPGRVAFRGLFVAPDLCAALPARATVVQIDSLTRELIEAAAGLAWDYPEDGPEARLMAVLLDRMVALPVAPLDLPGAQDKAVLKVMAALEADPADNRSLSAWAQFAFVSERTLARRFKMETGMSFAAWRERLRIIRAIEKIGAGMPISQAAFDLGYATPSSFTTMFRRVMGVSPSAYFE